MAKEIAPQPRIKPVQTKLAEPELLDTLQPAPQPQEATEADAERRLMVFRKIAAPLMAVVPSALIRDDAGSDAPNQSAAQFAALIDTTISLNQRLSETLGLDKVNAGARWQAASASTEIVAAHFRATGHALTPDEASEIVGALGEAITPGLLSGTPTAGGAEAEETASTLSRNLKALAPVASAIARFSFGRDPMDLLGEVVHRLTQIAAEATGRLEGKSDAATTSPLYFAVLEVAGEFYMESHFTEMDRLLEMAPDERKDYVQAHNRRIPLEPVWERLTLKMGLLEALTSYLPGGAQ